MSMSRHQNAGQNHDIKVDNKSFESVVNYSYSEMIVRYIAFIVKLRAGSIREILINIEFRIFILASCLEI
jgi:hypothetical protein